MTIQLTNKQISTLRSLHFWYRNMKVSAMQSDFLEYKKSCEAISFIYRDCDQLNIPFRIQNRVTNGAEQKISFSDIKL